jgi:hypothetical protein
VIFKRAEKYVKEYREAEREKIRLLRLSRKEGHYEVLAEPKVVFVIRIRGYAMISPSPRTTLTFPVSTRSPPSLERSSNSSDCSRSITVSLSV